MRTSIQLDRQTKLDHDKQLQRAQRLYKKGKQLHQDELFQEAAELFEQAIAIRETILGKYHRDTIKSYWQNGRALCHCGKDEAALRAFHRATRMSNKTFDHGTHQELWGEIKSLWAIFHETTDKRLEELLEVCLLESQGDACCKSKQFSKAIQFYEKAIGIQTGLVGHESLDGADLRCKLASCFLELSRLKEANEVFGSAHGLYARHLGAEHPATLGALASLKTVQEQGAKKRASHLADLRVGNRISVGV